MILDKSAVWESAEKSCIVGKACFFSVSGLCVAGALCLIALDGTVSLISK